MQTVIMNSKFVIALNLLVVVCSLLYISTDAEFVNETEESKPGKNNEKNDNDGSDKNKTPPFTWIEFLEKFGYLKITGKEDVEFDSATIAEATREAQKKFNLPETGKADKETTDTLLKARCGYPDKKDPNSTSFNLMGGKWKTSPVTWKLFNYWRQKKMPEEAQIKAMRKAFNFWTEVANIDFAEVTKGKPHISLKFADRRHGCPYPFDGPSGVLAHAFNPTHGGVHFDNDELFTDESPKGINLMAVAAHELGHALGLDHSSDRKALMFPYIHPYDPDFKLGLDDIKGIQHLYGPRKKGKNVSSKKKNNKKPSKSPIKPRDLLNSDRSCELSKKAIMEGPDGVLYLFHGDNFWKFDENGPLIGFPVPAKDIYQDCPSDISAAVYSPKTNKTYIFKDKTIWIYNQFMYETLKQVTSENYPANPKAAFFIKDQGDIYLYQDGKVQMFDENKLDVKPDNPVSLETLLPEIPVKPETLVKRYNGYLYVFYEDTYTEFDTQKKALVTGSPKKARELLGSAC